MGESRVDIMRRWSTIAFLGLLALVFLTGCSGKAGQSSNAGGTSAQPSPTMSTPAVQPTADATADVEAAVRAYSAAFLGGQAKQAWLMRTTEARKKDSYAMFVTAVNAAHQIYGDATMTSLRVTVNGGTAKATYRYDVGEIDQKNQRWFLRDGTWLVDN